MLKLKESTALNEHNFITTESAFPKVYDKTNKKRMVLRDASIQSLCFTLNVWFSGTMYSMCLSSLSVYAGNKLVSPHFHFVPML